MDNNFIDFSNKIKALTLDEFTRLFNKYNSIYRALLNNFIEIKHNIEQLLDYNFRYMNYTPSKSILEEALIEVIQLKDHLGQNLNLIECENNFITMEEGIRTFKDIYQKKIMLDEDIIKYKRIIEQNIIDWSYYFCDDESKKALISNDSKNNEKLLMLSNIKNYLEIFNYISNEIRKQGRKILNISEEDEKQAIKFIFDDNQYRILKSKGYDQLFWDLLKYDGVRYITYYDLYCFFHNSTIVTIRENEEVTSYENIEANKELCIVMDLTEEELVHNGYETMKEIRKEGYNWSFYDDNTKGAMVYEYLGYPRIIRFYLKPNDTNKEEYTMKFFSNAIYGKYE